MANNTITVKLTRSPIGRLPKHRETVKGLGLRKVGQTRELEDTPAVRGMVNKVYYMVKVVGE
ncbi:50S ribosomal protein L30 [Marinomonas sp.]|uniref:50S ribosomal protein L30 n=1 Tax=Marinomonas sp. TaxID=1904862 RepID=UPI003C70645A